MTRNPLKIIENTTGFNTPAYKIFVEHGEAVARKAIQIAKRFKTREIDLAFIYDAAMLHDIGVIQTNSSKLGCSGDYPYICHGYLGRHILDKMNMGKHGLVCERHVGVGISADEIKKFHLPLPVRDMMPISIEEKIICYADKFFSKTTSFLSQEKSWDAVIKSLEKYGQHKVDLFKKWHDFFIFGIGD